MKVDGRYRVLPGTAALYVVTKVGSDLEVLPASAERKAGYGADQGTDDEKTHRDLPANDGARATR